MESAAKIVGWLSFQSFYGRPAYRATAELSLYVAPTHLRQGIGYRLLEDAIRRSPELEIETLLGFIFAHNEPSLKLFEKFGFQRWGYLPKVAKLDSIDRDLAILGLKKC
jgi:phosphinothricin acetyltransferase